MKQLPKFKDMAKLFYTKFAITFGAYIVIVATVMGALSLSITWNFPKELSYALLIPLTILGGIILAFLMSGLDKHE